MPKFSLIYVFLFAVILIPGLIQYYRYKNSRTYTLIYLCVVGALLIFIGGFRYGVGFDYYSYANIWEEVSKTPFGKLSARKEEIGFLICLKLLTMFGIGLQGFYIFVSVVAAAIAMVMIGKYSKIPFISVFLFIALNYFYNAMNLVRYAIAGLICFTAYSLLMNSKLDYTKEKMRAGAFFKNLLTNFLPYTAIILLAASFHKSALIMIPVYFIAKIPFNYISLSVYGAATLVYLLFADPIIKFLSETFFGGSYNPEKNTVYTKPGGMYYIFIPLLVFAAALFASKALMKKDPRNIVLINLSYLSFLAYFIVAVKTYIFTRLVFFIYIFTIFLVPEMIRLLEPSGETFDKLAQLKEKMKLAPSQAARQKISQEFGKVRKTITDGRTFSNFGLWACIAFCIMFTSTQVYYGSHGIFPYVSAIDAVNDANRVFYSREDYNRTLISMPSMARYMFELKDKNYIVFIAACGENFGGLRDWTVKSFTQLGLNPDLKSNIGKNYLAIVSGGKKLYESNDEAYVQDNFMLGQNKVRLSMISGGTAGAARASIEIDGEEYALNKHGLNFVVYDTAREAVVDKVSFRTDLSSRDTMYPERESTPG